MRQYRKIILAALVAVATGYAAVAVVIGPWSGETTTSPTVLAACAIGFLLWVMVVLGIQAALTKPEYPDEREAQIDQRSEQLNARLLEAGVFALIAGVVIGAFLDPEGTRRFSTHNPDTLVFYLLGIVTFAAVGRFGFILHQEANG